MDSLKPWLQFVGIGILTLLALYSISYGSLFTRLGPHSRDCQDIISQARLTVKAGYAVMGIQALAWLVMTIKRIAGCFFSLRLALTSLVLGLVIALFLGLLDLIIIGSFSQVWNGRFPQSACASMAGP